MSQDQTTRTQHTPGPWEWVDDSFGRVRLQTPDRGRLIVMDFVRCGMQGATPRFAVMDDGLPRGRRGGILHAVDPWAHPDGRLIAAAPELLAALKEAENALADYIPTLERSGASLNYGHSVLAAARAAIQKAESQP